MECDAPTLMTDRSLSPVRCTTVCMRFVAGQLIPCLERLMEQSVANVFLTPRGADEHVVANVSLVV